MNPQQLLDLALDSVPIGTFHWNQVTDEICWNRHHFLILGLDPDTTKATYDTFRLRVHPDDLEALEADVRHARDTRGRHDYQFRVVRPDGSIRHVRGSGLFSYGANGKPQWMTGVVIDITDQHAVQEQLRKKEWELATLLQNSPDLYVRFDLQLRHLYVSPGIAKFTGMEPSEFIGKTNSELRMPHYLCLIWDSALNKAIVTKTPATMQFQYQACDRTHHLESRIIPEFDAAGEVESLLCITSDITEREEMIQALRTSEQRLARMDQAKDEFLATLAHELKTPLAAVAAGVELLQLATDDERSQATLETMSRQLTHLEAIVDELWDVSSIVEQKATFQWEPVDLMEVIGDAIALCQLELDKARHQLKLELPDTAVMVHGDRRRLLQIFVNLLGNAIKYTLAGGSLRIAATSDARQAVVEVEDNGIGIPEDRQARLYDMYFQMPRDGESTSGLGIGLAVVRRLVEMHRGGIDIRNKADESGTLVSVRFPSLHASLGAQDLPTARNPIDDATA